MALEPSDRLRLGDDDNVLVCAWCVSEEFQMGFWRAQRQLQHSSSGKALQKHGSLHGLMKHSPAPDSAPSAIRMQPDDSKASCAAAMPCRSSTYLGAA